MLRVLRNVWGTGFLLHIHFSLQEPTVVTHHALTQFSLISVFHHFHILMKSLAALIADITQIWWRKCRKCIFSDILALIIWYTFSMFIHKLSTINSYVTAKKQPAWMLLIQLVYVSFWTHHEASVHVHQDQENHL